MTELTINREYKDSLFKIIFGEHKEYALQLYNAISGTNYSNVDDLTITTIEKAVYVNVKNDVSLLFDDAMSLYEHQSKFNPNMPLRGLEYFAQLYSNHLETKVKGGHKAVFSSWRLPIPTPRYYVFYNGAAEQPDRCDMHLSDSYSSEGDVEVIAHMININVGHNKELMESCKPLADYSQFVHRIRNNIAAGLSREDAVKTAIDSCINDNILSELLRKERSKLLSPILTALSDEEIKELYQEDGYRAGMEEGHRAGLEEGMDAGKATATKEIVLNAYTNGHSIQEISDFSGIPIDMITTIIQESEAER